MTSRDHLVIYSQDMSRACTRTCLVCVPQRIKIQKFIFRVLKFKFYRLRLVRNCRVPISCMPKMIVLALFVASRLRFKIFQDLRAETRKIRVRQSRLGWLFVVNNRVRLSYYYHFKVIRLPKNVNFRFSALGSSQLTDFLSHH